jgi:1-acyl-sn-glycerol-3-phosphate acyltransferase
MRVILKPFQLLYAVYAMLAFIVLMIPVFIWSLLVMPAGKIKAGNLIFKACNLWGDAWYFLIFVRHRNIYEGGNIAYHSCIYVCNHTSYMDIPCIVKTFRHPVRPLGKAETSKVPIFGTIYKNAIVTVDRSNPANRARSLQALRSVLLQGISILVFPEGTFNESSKPLKDFYDGAFRLAIETGAPIRPVLMLDNHDRMHWRSVFTLNPGRSRSVFLDKITTDNLTMEDLPKLKAQVYSVMEEKLKEYGASWIGA